MQRGARFVVVSGAQRGWRLDRPQPLGRAGAGSGDDVPQRGGCFVVVSGAQVGQRLGRLPPFMRVGAGGGDDISQRGGCFVVVSGGQKNNPVTAASFSRYLLVGERPPSSYSVRQV